MEKSIKKRFEENGEKFRPSRFLFYVPIKFSRKVSYKTQVHFTSKQSYGFRKKERNMFDAQSENWLQSTHEVHIHLTDVRVCKVSEVTE